MTRYLNVLAAMSLMSIALSTLFVLIGITIFGVIPFREHYKIRPIIRLCTGVTLFLLFALMITFLTYPTPS